MTELPSRESNRSPIATLGSCRRVVTPDLVRDSSTGRLVRDARGRARGIVLTSGRTVQNWRSRSASGAPWRACLVALGRQDRDRGRGLLGMVVGDLPRGVQRALAVEGLAQPPRGPVVHLAARKHGLDHLPLAAEESLGRARMKGRVSRPSRRSENTGLPRRSLGCGDVQKVVDDLEAQPKVPPIGPRAAPGSGHEPGRSRPEWRRRPRTARRS